MSTITGTTANENVTWMDGRNSDAAETVVSALKAASAINAQAMVVDRNEGRNHADITREVTVELAGVTRTVYVVGAHDAGVQLPNMIYVRESNRFGRRYMSITEAVSYILTGK